MKHERDADLSRRERQIMEIIYASGEASVADIAGALPDPPSHTAVRTFLRILEQKGRVRRRRDGKKHIYLAKGSRKRAARAALKNVLTVFFGDSLGDAVAAHLADPRNKMNEEELERLSQAIERARREGN